MTLFAARCLMLQLLLLATTATTDSATPSSSSTDDHYHGGVDERALLDFKAKMSGHSGVLDSWNQSTSYCSWEGVTCGGKRHRWRVVALDLSYQSLAGTISPAIGDLAFLRSLNLSSNGLQGEIPPSIGSLRRLRRIDLGLNMLGGVIPSNISHCISLRVMNIYGNKGVHGIIPVEIGGMPSLSVLQLPNNSITGTIPSSLANLSRLAVLSLALNYLEGPIPAGIGNNPYLGFLQLSSNKLSGLFPPSLYNLSSARYLSVGNNEQLHGRLPTDLGKTLPSIKTFGLVGNRFTGPLPLSLTNLSRLQELWLGVNGFVGTVPAALGRSQQNLESIILNGNMLEANSEKDWEFVASLTNCSRLQVLNIGWNMFAGRLPSSLANLSTSLQLLRVRINNISGVIPSEIENLVNLQQLDFGGNFLTGAIPDSIGKLTQLKQLYLHTNNFSGAIPSSFGNLSYLFLFAARGNILEGSIPPSIGKLSQLSYLDLSSNKLTGIIPNEIMNLSSMTIALNLSNNLLEGPIPLQVGNLVNLEKLYLWGNKLSGEIPDTIGNCRVLETLSMHDNLFQGNIPATFKNLAGLTVLNLMKNKLNGTIPGNLGTLTNLRGLYLAHNNLSGSIPELLCNSTSLLHLDLSFNNLQGEVPKEGVFRNVTRLSIIGNNALCGGIPQLHLPKCPSSSERNNKKGTLKSLVIAIPTAGALLLILLGFVWGILYCKFKTAPKKESQVHFAEVELPMIPYNNILKGTDGFSQVNVLGKGRYGTVYKGTLDNQESVVAIKVFNVQQSGSYKSFQAECEALRRVKHRCLVKIITCCSSINHQGQDFRALVFEFMPNGTLDQWIHNLEGQNGQVLSLSQRLDIAVDVVDALEYLHKGCQPSIIHCDLKPSNILLNQDMRARVGDFGIARVLDQETSKHPVNSASTLGIRGSIGYIAPEYGEGLAVSTCGDMFSLGTTLLEMFTAKRPTDDMFRDGISLHGYAEAALPDKVMEIADSNLRLQDEASSSSDTRHITRNRECLSAVIQIGLLCSKQLSTERLSISDAAAEMRVIRDKYIRAQ